MSNLKRIKEKKEALLWAAVAALLHDWRKCSDENLRVSAHPKPENAQGLSKSYLQSRLQSSIQVDLLHKVSLLELIEKGRKGNPEEQSLLLEQAYLRRCHRASHVEKEETDDTGKQRHDDTRLSTPFGIESGPVSGLTQLLDKLPWSQIQDQAIFRPALQSAFAKALGETRRPENEITLWDWSLVVAALYKAALAGALLGYKPDPNELRWRLLSVRFDGLGFLSEAHRIPDLLGRKKALERALDRVKTLLEEEYPLGTEVYRDENGSVFVVPGCEKGNCALKLLDLKDKDESGQSRSLHELIEEKFKNPPEEKKFRLEGEIVPAIRVDEDLREEPWWGQDPKWERYQGPFNDELPPVAKHLEPITHQPDPEMIAKEWNTSKSRAEVCTVCGLRPQLDPQQEPRAEGRHICRVCLERQIGRVEEWLSHLETTVWINEVADLQGRIALIVGRFDLNHWLDGTLVRTMTVIDPARPGPIPYVLQKIPSFVRLYRIWNTTRRFWGEVCPVEPADSEIDLERSVVGKVVGKAGPRLAIKGSFQPQRAGMTVQRHYAYELVLEGGGKLSVVWDGERFLTCDNLEYLESERQLGHPVKEALPSDIAVRVEQPVGYGSRNKHIGEFVVRDVKGAENSEYVPVIPLLAEPQTFMTLVPAEYAIEIVKKIKHKYEREMGKVRNRLPLHLGIVFAHRRTPLRAILDTARRLLETQGLPAAGWRVEGKEEARDAFTGDPHFSKALRLRLKLRDREATWLVPLMMGDGDISDPDQRTKDVWYPYAFCHGPEPLKAKRRFLSQNPYDRDENGAPKEGWLVHVEDLEKDDTIYFTPATFDWVWLDSNARRFELAYDGQGQRRSSHLKRRPYLLDELETLEHIWQTLDAHLHRNQIHILHKTIEAKREQWGFPSPYDEGFRRFCWDLLAEAEWRKGSSEDIVPEDRRGKLPWEVDGLEKDKWLERWVDYAARGWLADAVELFWEILKAREEEEPSGAETKEAQRA